MLDRARALTLGVCGGRMCKQKYAAWEAQKTPGKGLETGRVQPKWEPGDDYCTLLERVEAADHDDLFVQTVKCRGSCERGPNAIAIDDDTGEELELEEMCLETGRITLFGLRSRARMDDVVAKAAAYNARRWHKYDDSCVCRPGGPAWGGVLRLGLVGASPMRPALRVCVWLLIVTNPKPVEL